MKLDPMLYHTTRVDLENSIIEALWAKDEHPGVLGRQLAAQELTSAIETYVLRVTGIEKPE